MKIIKNGLKIKESIPINIETIEGISIFLKRIFEPPIGGNRIVKLYVKNGKLEIQYNEEKEGD